MARGVRRQLEGAHLPVWRGEPLYPAGTFSWYAQGSAITFSYSHSLVVNRKLLATLAASEEAEGDGDGPALYARLEGLLGDYPQVGAGIAPDLRLGGANYTHSILNYGRVLREGLNAYQARVEAALETARQRGLTERIAFCRAMLDLLAGLRAAHARALEALRAQAPADAARRAVWWRLVTALERVPWAPARDFYEALVAANWLYYLDGCDNLGRFDQDLGPYYQADLEAGCMTEAEAVALVGRLWANVDANTGWDVALGGATPDGRDLSNRLTRVCLIAARGRRRPSLALRLAPSTPETIWQAALDTIATGCGLPALYNESLYHAAIAEAHLNVAPADLPNYAFGGCTELMVHGCSNVGSLDGGFNLPLILSRTLRAHLATAPTFEALWEAFQADIAADVVRMAHDVSAAQADHARHQPQPIRTLLVDDCLEAAAEFNAGGARYNWSVINVGGLGNVADSLAAVREVVFERGEVDGATLWRALEADFDGYEALRQRLERCPRYGNDDPAADGLARAVAERVFTELRRYAPWRGGRFIPGCLMFVTYAQAGEAVMATPDGRRAGAPIADSIGAVAGRDRRGPTALIRSVASLPQHLAPGTLVTNFRFAPAMFQGEGRDRLIELIRAYFRLGGLQMQITVVDQATLRAAVAEPERYGDLIVRIGGYSEYWRNLTPALRETVLARSEHSA
jgi:formate C-acetyltransferase